ncbi:hexokinase-7 [Microdochium trichocladiopsis]|uniref:Phosphotransferase n=1 Tax=Microdochium trichocladiopsis TaxID=1682393 RepID=A0A9P9BT95_9PEZI|nr:hexokinase-7 [Microdochium trichocladiopsis]KAH7035399.1 hexokinase-7 [Microdochium trichocladiopsis]
MAPFSVEDYLAPLQCSTETAHQLSHEMYRTFQRLSAESLDQFLPTPIAESILRPADGQHTGRYLAIDIGGTNLRVGFIELPGNAVKRRLVADQSDPNLSAPDTGSPPFQRLLERSWPILEHLKSQTAEDLFKWIGTCIVEVVQAGRDAFNYSPEDELPMGVTFSFPMVQQTLSDATLMTMGKGFTMSSKMDLATHLRNGYKASAPADLPRITVSAILNDSVATLVSFIHQSQEHKAFKAAMGLIVGTGCNATIPLRDDTLHPSKKPSKIGVAATSQAVHENIAVNTEWSINGTAPALRKFKLVTSWDEQLDAAGEAPGFQPLEYMTAGRYLGELGRLILLEYMIGHLGHTVDQIPARLLERFGLTTKFLSHFRPDHSDTDLVQTLETEFPSSTAATSFAWTDDLAQVLYRTAKAIELRAAGIIAAAIVGLLACAGDIPLRGALENKVAQQQSTEHSSAETRILGVGYTGGCIMHFQDYLEDVEHFLATILEREFGKDPAIRIVLKPCHDGGITGAGVLCAASLRAASVSTVGSATAVCA